MARAGIIVHRTVQRVGFRYAVLDAATSLEIAGHVKNIPNGTVEIVAEGPRENIESLTQKIRDVREPAVVKDIQVSYSETTGKFESFRIAYQDSMEALEEGFATGYALLTRSDKKQDKMLEKQDQMLDVQGKTVGAIHGLSDSMHDMMDRRFRRLDGKIRLIKEKI